ncbi:MAG: 30S ribosomal protein S6 [Thermoleophilia bacterium]|nr:30S ribosomal protein S6 [Thermoleophilia bacterium]
MTRVVSTNWRPDITPYEIMIILNPDAEEERQQEMLERVQQIIRDGGGVIDQVNDWGRKKIGYQMRKRADGRYVVITCSSPAEALAEAERVMTINVEVVTRHLVIRHNRVEAERQKAQGFPAPVDDRPEGEARPQRAGRGGGRGRRPR